MPSRSHEHQRSRWKKERNKFSTLHEEKKRKSTRCMSVAAGSPYSSFHPSVFLFKANHWCLYQSLHTAIAEHFVSARPGSLVTKAVGSSAQVKHQSQHSRPNDSGLSLWKIRKSSTLSAAMSTVDNKFVYKIMILFNVNLILGYDQS